MTIGTNTSPLAGRAKGTKVTARLVKDRLDRELVGNVSIRVLPTERPDTWEVQGRGELALAILVETDAARGLRADRRQAAGGHPGDRRQAARAGRAADHRRARGVPRRRHPAAAPCRKGRMEQMTNHGTGWVRMEFLVPARGLIGFRTEFLTDTRGTGIAHHVFEGYEPWAGDLRTRPTGSLVADRTGVATSYAMFNLQERGTLFVEPTTEVYEGMIVGENSRADDMDVNITKEKKLTNVRSRPPTSSSGWCPPATLSLEQSLEFCREDECVEVTPDAVRIRKVVLVGHEREKCGPAPVALMPPADCPSGR